MSRPFPPPHYSQRHESVHGISCEAPERSMRLCGNKQWTGTSCWLLNCQHSREDIVNVYNNNIVLAFGICCIWVQVWWQVSLICHICHDSEIFLTPEAYNRWQECGGLPAHIIGVLTAGASLSLSHSLSLTHTHTHTHTHFPSFTVCIFTLFNL